MPLHPGESTARLTLFSNELGHFHYDLLLRALPPPPEKSVDNTLLGSSHSVTVMFNNYSRFKTEYCCKVKSGKTNSPFFPFCTFILATVLYMWSVSAFITEASFSSALYNSSTQKVDLLANTLCYLCPPDWPSGLYCRQECQHITRFPFGLKGQHGGPFQALSAGVNKRPAKPVFSNWWWIHLSPTQTSRPVQHQSRWERHYPLQECVPADHHFLSSGKEQVEFTKVGTIRQSEQRVKVKNVLST